MISIRPLLVLIATANVSLSSEAAGQVYTAGYVELPANYVSDPAVRSAFEKALGGKIQWQSFATEEQMAEAIASGSIQVGIGQTVSGWLDGINKGQPTLALGLSRTEAVPCFVAEGVLAQIKTNEKETVTVELAGELARDNILKQLDLAGIDQAKVTFQDASSFPVADVDIDCVPGRPHWAGFQPLLSDVERADLAVASTTLITAAPETKIDLKGFLVADDAAKSVAAAKWAADGESASIVLPSILDQNIDYSLGNSILQRVASYSGPTGVTAATPYVEPSLLIELASGVRAVKLLFGTDRQWLPKCHRSCTAYIEPGGAALVRIVAGVGADRPQARQGRAAFRDTADPHPAGGGRPQAALHHPRHRIAVRGELRDRGVQHGGTAGGLRWACSGLCPRIQLNLRRCGLPSGADCLRYGL